MHFNTAIPTQPQPDYHQSSALKPSRDSDSTPSQWKRNRAAMTQVKQLTENVGRIYREVRKSRPRALGVIPGFPFRCYNVAPQYCIQTDSTGPQDSWRTFQIAAGMIGARSAFDPLTEPAGNPAFVNLEGNGEIQLAVLDGTDGLFDNDGDGLAQGESDSHLDFTLENYGLYTGPSSPIPPQVVVLGSTPTAGVEATQWLLSISPSTNSGPAGNWQGAAFWIQITDTGTNGFNAAVYGSMVALNNGLDSPWFPQGPGIIPIAMIVPNYANPDPSYPPAYNPSTDIGRPFSVVQCTYNHVVNRFAAPYVAQTPASTGPFIGPHTYRGDWANDQLSGLAFYPGDLVVDSTQTLDFPSVGPKVNLRLYLNISNEPQILSIAPPSDDINWLQIGGLI